MIRTNNKYLYSKVIQQNYGNGWEDCESYDADSSYIIETKENREAFKSDLKEYKLMGYPTRVSNRKELNTTLAQ